MELTGYTPPRDARPSTGARFASAAAQPGRAPKVLQALRCWDDTQLDYQLLHAVVRHLVLGGSGGGGGGGGGGEDGGGGGGGRGGSAGGAGGGHCNPSCGRRMWKQ